MNQKDYWDSVSEKKEFTTPFKLVGGVAKGHPTEDEIRAAVKFYESLEG